MFRFATSLGLLLPLSACAAISSAQMRLPPSLSAQPATEMMGITGWNKGTLSFAGYTGQYSRSDTRLTFFDKFKRTGGHYRFTLAGPEISDDISADCRMGEKELTFGSLALTTRPIAYRCDFLAGGRIFPARFELQQSMSSLGAALNQYERRGEIALGGEIVQFRSVHHLAGTSLPTSAPVGYQFEQGGVPVGAIELNGRPRFITAPGVDPGLRRTMAVASVALALLRDPA